MLYELSKLTQKAVKYNTLYLKKSLLNQILIKYSILQS